MHVVQQRHAAVQQLHAGVRDAVASQFPVVCVCVCVQHSPSGVCWECEAIMEHRSLIFAQQLVRVVVKLRLFTTRKICLRFLQCWKLLPENSPMHSYAPSYDDQLLYLHESLVMSLLIQQSQSALRRRFLSSATNSAESAEFGLQHLFPLVLSKIIVPLSIVRHTIETKEHSLYHTYNSHSFQYSVQVFASLSLCENKLINKRMRWTIIIARD